MPYCLQAAGAAGVALWIGWVAAEAGDRCLGHFQSPVELTKLERFLIGSGLGIGLLALAVFLLGSLHLWYPIVFWTLLGSSTLLFLKVPHFGPTFLKITTHRLDPWTIAWMASAGVCFSIYGIGMLTPEIFYDALHYHLAVPNLYSIAHRIYDIPSLVYSNFILTIQLLYGFAITLAGPVSAKTLHVWTGLLLLGTFVAFGRRYLSEKTAWLAAAIFFSLPIVGISLVASGVDLAWSFLTFLSAFVLVMVLLDPQRRGLVLAGTLTGLAASCKFLGFPIIPIGILLIVWKDHQEDRMTWRQSAFHGMVFALPAITVLLPYLIRNSLFHGNPLYPFGGTGFGHPAFSAERWKIFLTDGESASLAQALHARGSLAGYALGPWLRRLRWPPMAFDLNPLCLLGAIGLFWPSKLPAFRLLRTYAVLLWLLWMCTAPLPRFGLPAIALLVFLASNVVVSLHSFPKMRTGLFVLLTLSIVSSLFFIALIGYDQGGWRVLSNRESESHYLSRPHTSYPAPPYSGIDWMNRHLPSGSKILFMGDSRTYYSWHLAIPSGVPDEAPLVALSKATSQAQPIAQALRAQGVTHLFFNSGEAARTRSYGLLSWNFQEWRRFQVFWEQDVVLLWKDDQGLYVYQLLSEKEAALPHAEPPNPFLPWAPR